MKGAKTENTENKVNFYVNAIYFLVMICLVTMRVCSYFGLFSFLGEYGSYYLSIFTQIGIILLLPTLLLKFITKSKTKDVVKFCCYKKVSYKVVLVSVLLGAVVFFLNVYVSNFFNSIISLFGYKHASSGGTADASWLGLVLSLICTAVLPAICEEALHRGMLLNGNSMLGVKKSILISGVLFGLLHLNIEQFFYATIIGLFLGYLCWGCSSIWPCIIVHFMNNALSVLLSFASAKGWAVGKIFDSIAVFVTGNKIIGVLFFILLLCLLVYLAIEMVRFLLRETFRYNFEGKQKELTSLALREAYFQSVENLKNSNVGVGDSAIGAQIIDEREFLEFVNANLEMIIKKSASQFEKEKDFKIDTRSEIFLCGSFILGIIITILTFIWGLF